MKYRALTADELRDVAMQTAAYFVNLIEQRVERTDALSLAQNFSNMLVISIMTGEISDEPWKSSNG